MQIVLTKGSDYDIIMCGMRTMTDTKNQMGRESGMRRKIYFWVKENVNSDTVRLAILAIPLDAHTSVGFNGFVMTSDRQSIPFIYYIRHSAS